MELGGNLPDSLIEHTMLPPVPEQSNNSYAEDDFIDKEEGKAPMMDHAEKEEEDDDEDEDEPLKAEGGR